ncbi:MAG: hypothetical protein KDA60_23095, partial [Planctomycetales bacterium]|nr:hypothetical protein [Planctomycetales bacterium]
GRRRYGRNRVRRIDGDDNWDGQLGQATGTGNWDGQLGQATGPAIGTGNWTCNWDRRWARPAQSRLRVLLR